MAYTPINWAENLDVDATKLDKMDNQIDANDNDISNHESRITTNENEISNINNYISSNIITESGSITLSKYNSRTINLSFTADFIIVKDLTDYSTQHTPTFDSLKFTNSFTVSVDDLNLDQSAQWQWKAYKITERS